MMADYQVTNTRRYPSDVRALAFSRPLPGDKTQVSELASQPEIPIIPRIPAAPEKVAAMLIQISTHLSTRWTPEHDRGTADCSPTELKLPRLSTIANRYGLITNQIIRGVLDSIKGGRKK